MIDWPNDFRSQLETHFGIACPEVLKVNGGGGIWKPTPVMRQALDAVKRPYGIISFGEMTTIPQGTGKTGFLVLPMLTVGYKDPENEAAVILAICNLVSHFDTIDFLTHNYQKQNKTSLHPPDADPWNKVATDEGAQVIFASAQFSFLCDTDGA